MGVRGLTTFIAKNQEKFLIDYKLRDTYLVIDGYSLCAQLYKFHTKSNDSFGGDYDKYSKCIETFFSMLQQCNIIPIVIFDGGYEKKKLRTVQIRLKNKIRVVRNANPVSLCGNTVFPLFVREVFNDTVLKLNIATARCDYEADFEIACIARNLNCPVLSYDSDFYIFDVLYIPFPTLDFHTSKIKADSGSNLYMGCKVYRIETFLKHFGGLNKTHIPLIATLLGNDYIKKGVFKNFYAHLKLSKKKSGERSDQQRTITALLKWLRSETYDSAIKKILGRLRHKHRSLVAKQIVQISEGYICTDSEILNFLELSGTNKRITTDSAISIDLENINSDSDNENVSSDSADSDNESDEESLEGDTDLTSITQSEQVNCPDWFKMKYRKSEFPTVFMDLLSLNTCFYIPQVEDTKNLHTIEISLPVLRAIAKILLSNNSTYFIYLARSEYGRIKKYNVDVSDLELPKLADLENLSVEESTNVLLLVLGLNESHLNLILQLPSNWQLYLLSLIYWARNSVVPIATFCHVYSIILCLLNLNIVDKNAGYYRAKSLFLKKFGSKLKNILACKKELNDLSIVNKDDCLFFIDAFVSNFEMDNKMKTNRKLFSLEIVDAFSQFQTCLFYIKHLNALLNYPFAFFDISLFLNGTFLYNFYANLITRNDIDAYIELLLKNSPSLLSIFKNTVRILESVLSLKKSETTHKKRRRRKRKAEKKDEISEDEQIDKDESNNDSEYDANNKFSILRLVD